MTTARIDDPTLDALVPASTRSRNALLAMVVMVVLVGAWFSPQLLRPTLGETTDGIVNLGSGGATPVPQRHQVAASAYLAPHAVGPVTVTAVDDVPGARVIGAWVHTGDLDDPDSLLSWASVSGTPSEDTFEDASGRLPAVARDADQLEVLWQIDDCTVLDPEATVTVHLRTALGTDATNEVSSDWNPGQMYADEWFGPDVCP